MVLFLILSTIHIKVTTRVQLIVGIVTVAVIILVDLVTTAKGGSHGQALSAFSFDHTLKGGFSGVFYGIILGVTSYIGFETAADFGEETSNPRRNIPIAIIAATTFAVVLYLFTTYSIDIGYGVNNGAKFGADPIALKTRPPRLSARGSAPWSRSAAWLPRSSCASPAPRPPPAPSSRWGARASFPRRSPGRTRASGRRSTRPSR